MTAAALRLSSGVNRCLVRYHVVRNRVSEANNKMKPGEEFAAQIDVVMSKMLTRRNPISKKEFSFSILDFLKMPDSI